MNVKVKAVESRKGWRDLPAGTVFRFSMDATTELQLRGVVAGQPARIWLINGHAYVGSGYEDNAVVVVDGAFVEQGA